MEHEFRTSAREMITGYAMVPENVINKQMDVSAIQTALGLPRLSSHKDQLAI